MRLIKTILLPIILIVFTNSCNNKDQEITSYRGKVKFETISLSSKLGGRINKLYVEEGQTVQKGDTLVEINIPEVDAKIKQIDGMIKAANAQLNMAYNGATLEQKNQITGKLDASIAQLNFAQESYNRLQLMFVDSLVSKQKFEEVEMKVKMAEAQVNAITAKKEEIDKGARIELIEQAKGQLIKAEGVKEELMVAAAEKYMIAPANMSIETISLKEGELLTPGYTMINAYEDESVYFRFTIPESKIHNFKKGQELTLVNPYSEEENVAKISIIKQLPKYANITSTDPLYKLSESIYEIKLLPVGNVSKQTFYNNSTILIK